MEDYFPMELRDSLTHATIIALQPAVVIAAMTNLVNQVTLTAHLLDRPMLPAPPPAALASAPSRAPLRAMGVPLRPTQEARHAARYARKGRGGRKKNT